MSFEVMKEGFARKQAELAVARLKELSSLEKKAVGLRAEVRELMKMIRSAGFDPKKLIKESGGVFGRDYKKREGVKKDGERKGNESRVVEQG